MIFAATVRFVRIGGQYTINGTPGKSVRDLPANEWRGLSSSRHQGAKE